jgi:lipoprotein
MKKIFTLAFVALTLLATACGKSNNDNPNPQDDAKKALIGTWKIESVTDEGEEIVLNECRKKSYILFTEKQYVNTNFNKEIDECKESSNAFSYVISNNKLILSDTEKKTYTYTFSIVGNKLTLIHSEKNNMGNETEIEKRVYVKE